VPGYLRPPGTAMVPVRGVFEHLGAEVNWDGGKQEAVVSFGDHKVVLRCGSGEALVDGKAVALPVIPEVRNGRAFVPLRFVVESLGLKAEWDQNAYIVYF